MLKPDLSNMSAHLLRLCCDSWLVHASDLDPLIGSFTGRDDK